MTSESTKLPCEECKGQCCTYPTMSQVEFARLLMFKKPPKETKIIHVGTTVILSLKNGNCPYLEGGKCSVYQARPQVCRDYGHKKELPCAYLYPEKAEERVNTFLEKMKKGRANDN